ncbi:MAG: hypothetical protein GWP10_19960 [Nitrospiraceae bacterium]|nr:hypothetical protein [Nitrospiraceae bacterium]
MKQMDMGRFKMNKAQKYSLIGGIVGVLIAIILSEHIEPEHELMLLLNGAIAGAIVGMLYVMFSVIILVDRTDGEVVIFCVIAGIFGAACGTIVGTAIGMIMYIGIVAGVFVSMIGGTAIGIFVGAFVGMISFPIISGRLGVDDALLAGVIFGVPLGATIGTIIGAGVIDNAMTKHPYLIFIAIIAIGYSSGLIYGMKVDEKSRIHKEKPFTQRRDIASGQIDAAKHSLQKAERRGVAVQSANEIFAKAQSAFDKCDYFSAEGYAQRCRYLVEESIHGRKRPHMINDAHNIRVDTKEIKNKRIKSQNYAKGFEFEKYVISLFNEEKWVIERVSSDVSEAVGRYVHSDSWPDLTIKNRRTGRQFSIECKYRSNFYTYQDCKQIRWAEEHQIRNYNKFQNKENHPVYVIIGVGGPPSKPERLFLLPLNSLRRPFVKEDCLSDFELSLNDENMIDIDWFR